MAEALAPRSVGGNKPLRWFCGRRNSSDASIVVPIDLTGALVLAYIRHENDGSNLADFDGEDISASISATPTDGNIDHDPTANQITQLRSGNYTWNLKVTETDGTISFLPADEVGGNEVAFGTLLVFDNLATS